MYKIERIQKIKEIIYDRRQIDVSTLSELLDVSDATIRNDLEELEKEGYLTRFHGGARLNAEQAQENINQNLNGIEYDKHKEELGMIASSLIGEKEWIFLGPGTTSYFIAKALVQRQNMYVMTNNLLVSNILNNNTSIQTLLLGGRLHNYYTIPDDIMKELSNIYLSKSFFSIDGADIESGYTLTDVNVLNIIKAVSSKCKETIFAVDCTKFGQHEFMKLGDLDFAQTVISNENLGDGYKKYFLEHGINIHTSYDIGGNG